MIARDIIVIGASTGGVEALPTLLGTLPADLPAAAFVVLHLPAQADDLLSPIIQKKSALPVHTAIDGQEFARGNIYVAPPDYHMLIDGPRLRLSHGPRESRHRPAINPLFRSAAKFYGPRVVGVLLTGQLDDGVIGLNTIKTHGGTAIVQSPEETVASGMVCNALQNVRVDFTLPLAEMGQRLVALAHAKVDLNANGNGSSLDEPPVGVDNMNKNLGPPTPYICPECHGPLWERRVGDLAELRCHVGHAYSVESLLVDQNYDLERALWSAVRAFEEQAHLLRRMAKRDVKGPLLEKWEAQAALNEKNADAIRTLLQARR